MQGNSGLSGLSGLVNSMVYLLLDRFVTDAGAPLVSPRSGEPGPGTLAITDTSSLLSISGGALQAAGGKATPSYQDPMAIGSVAGKVAGRAFLVDVLRTSAGHARFGWSNAGTSTQEGIHWNSGQDLGVMTNAANFSTGVILALNTSYQVAIVQRGAGALVFVKGGAFTGWTLHWVTTVALLAGTQPIIGNHSSVGSYDNLRVVDLAALDSRFGSDYGIATQRKASSANTDTLTMTADALVEHTITAATGVTQELMVRRVDDNNCWIVRMDQAGGTIQLIEKVAGVETSRSSAAQTWSNGTAYRVVVVCDGTTIRTYVANTAKNSYSSAASNQTATVVKVSHAGSDLVAWPRAVTLPGGV